MKNRKLTQHTGPALKNGSFRCLLDHILRVIPSHRKHLFGLFVWSMALSRCRKSVHQMFYQNQILSLAAGLTKRRWYGLLGSPKLPWNLLWNAIIDLLLQRDRIKHQGRILLALDDTLLPKTGKHISGADVHFDHAHKQNSSKWVWGHCRVMVGLLQQVHGRWACLPLGQELYRRGEGNPSKLVLAALLIQRLYFRTKEPILVICDSWFGVRPLLKALQQFAGNDIHILSRLRVNASLYDLPQPPTEKRKGRPRKYGKKLPHIKDLAKTLKKREIKVQVYGKDRTCKIKEYIAISRPLKTKIKIVMVIQRNNGVFPIFTTDLSLSAEQMVEYYAARWKIEAAFRELKLNAGAMDNQARNEMAVENHFNLCCLTMTLLWIYADLQRKAPRRFHPGITSGSYALTDIQEQIRKEELHEINFPGFCSNAFKQAGNYIISRLFGTAA